MEEFELIPLSEPTRWKEVLAGNSHDFSHTWDNCYAMHLTTGYATYLTVFRSGNIIIFCPIAERVFKGYVDIVTPYGFSGFTGNHDFPDFQRHWKKFARERGYVCGYISLNPLLLNNTYLDANEGSAYNVLYFLNLNLTLDELSSRFDRNRRRQLKHWPEQSAQCITQKEVLKIFLLTNYHEFFKNKSASPSYLFSLETLSYLADLENVLMVGFMHDARIEAVSVFVYTPYLAQSLFHISLPAGRHHTMPLLWHAIIKLKSIGIPVLNLGGGITEGDSIAQFKERLGADKLPLKNVKQVYDEETYFRLCTDVGADYLDRKGYFPAYRQP